RMPGRGRWGRGFRGLPVGGVGGQDEKLQARVKVGTRLPDRVPGGLAKKASPLRASDRPLRVDTRIVPDVWLEPAILFEAIGAEITLSPVHTAGWDVVRKGSGLAIRFPRFTRVREDKSPTDATTVKELVEMYRRRVKKAG